MEIMNYSKSRNPCDNFPPVSWCGTSSRWWTLFVKRPSKTEFTILRKVQLCIIHARDFPDFTNINELSPKCVVSMCKLTFHERATSIDLRARLPAIFSHSYRSNTESFEIQNLKFMIFWKYWTSKISTWLAENWECTTLRTKSKLVGQ